MDAKHQVLGISRENRPLELYTVGHGTVSVLLLGGVHGDEVEGFDLAERFLAFAQKSPTVVPAGVTLSICPRVNPDGCAGIRRTNHHNVDLNRNLPTKDWVGAFTNVRYYPGPSACSEPENKILVKLIDDVKPKLILSMHSYAQPMVNYNGEISLEVAQKMCEKNGLEPKGDIGYPTPGSLGAYAGIERRIPTITLEILRGQDLDSVWQTHRTGLEAALQWAAETNR